MGWRQCHCAGGTTLINNQYPYSDATNITNWTNATGNHAFGYDLVDRLTSATNSSQPNESCSYDGVGNRSASHLSAGYSYQPETDDAERLVLQLDPMQPDNALVRKVSLEQFANFTPQQRQAICEWLRFARKWNDLKRFKHWVDAAIRYWCPNATDNTESMHGSG